MNDLAILDEASLTGEAEPVQRPAGERVRSGVVNAGPPFDLIAVTTAAQSTYAGIVRLVAEGQKTKAPFVRLADRYALVFIPTTLVIAGVPGSSLAIPFELWPSWSSRLLAH